MPVFEQNDTCLFSPIGKEYAYSRTEKDFSLPQAIDFSIPVPLSRGDLLAYKGSVDSVSYFYAQLNPKALSENKPKPKNICIYMDASGSSARQDLGKITSFLDAYFQYLGKANISLYTVANTVTQTHTYRLRQGRCPDLHKAIVNTVFDGASQLGNVNFKKTKADEIILISDGLSNYGSDPITLSHVPVLVINASPVCDHAYLSHIASETSGVYIHLNSSSIGNALSCSIRKNLMVLSVHAEQGEVYDVLCDRQINSNNSFSLVGRIKSATACLRIDWGYNDTVVYSEQYKIDNQNPITNVLVERIWVNKKINELDIDRKKNKAEETQFGKRFSIVTANTSLIVLEDAEDYMKYDIAPPDELKEAYSKIPKPEKQDLQQLKKKQMDDALKDFSEKMKWTKIS